MKYETSVCFTRFIDQSSWLFACSVQRRTRIPFTELRASSQQPVQNTVPAVPAVSYSQTSIQVDTSTCAWISKNQWEHVLTRCFGVHRAQTWVDGKPPCYTTPDINIRPKTPAGLLFFRHRLSLTRVCLSNAERSKSRFNQRHQLNVIQ